MLPNPSHRATPGAFRIAAPLLALAAIAAATKPGEAGAVCRVVPGPEGESSAWLTAGPFATPQTRPLRPVDAQLSLPLAGVDFGALRPTAGAPVGSGGRWMLRNTADARLSLDAGSRAARGARTGLAAVELHARAATRGYLMLGSDDGLAVFLDGREVYRRGAVRDARDDDDLVPFELAPGAHRLVLRVSVNGGTLRINARLLDTNFAPHAGVQVVLPGVDDAGCTAAQAASVRADIAREVTAQGLSLRASVRFPGGIPAVDGVTALGFELRSGALVARANAALEATGARSVEASLALPEGHADGASLSVSSATSPLARVGVAVANPVRRALRAARALDGLDEAHPPAFLPRASLTSLRFVAERLAQLVSDEDRDAEHLLEEAATLQSLVDDVNRGRDPYATRTGVMRRGYRSEIDNTLQGYSLYVPASYRAATGPMPMVVALHGLHGSAHRMLPVLFGVYDEHEDRTHADRHFAQLPDARTIVLAPFGRGDAGYRSLGEVDVMRAIDEVRASYRVDATRTYMTGLSMGGIGAASIPLHFPGVFAAAAPLCGYHSYFVRNDTRGPRRPWELALMETRSNVSWAENGQHLPMYVVHGLRDTPTANSRTLVDRYTELHYRMESEWPDLGHNVWGTTYAEGRIFPYLSRFRLDTSPRTVVLRSSDPRYATNAWVTLDALEAPGASFAQVSATAQARRVTLQIDRATGVTVNPPAAVFEQGLRQYELYVGNSRIADATVGTPVHLARGAGGAWSVSSEARTSPLRGSIRDVFDRPVTVVYGTQRPDETAMNRRVAEAWARLKPGVRGRIPVVADTELTEAMRRERSLVLVGTFASNSVLSSLENSLPIRSSEGALRLEGTSHRYAGAGVGATFTAAHPHRADRVLLVVTGTDVRGVWRSRFLPELVPDFAVYDGEVAPARGRILLGRYARLRAAGFWRADGGAPSSVDDPQPREAAGGQDNDRGEED